MEFGCPPPKLDEDERLCVPEYLQAEAKLGGITVLLMVGDEIDGTYSGFHTADQLRKFGKWLMEVAEEREKYKEK